MPYLIEQQKQSKSILSETGWTNGIYVGRAIGSSLNRRNPYPDSPLRLYEYKEDSDGEEVYKMTDADRFWAFAMVYNAKHIPPATASSDSAGSVIGDTSGNAT